MLNKDTIIDSYSSDYYEVDEDPKNVNYDKDLKQENEKYNYYANLSSILGGLFDMRREIAKCYCNVEKDKFF